MYDDAPSPDAPLRVLVVDADERVRESLAGLLAIGEQVIVVGCAGDPNAALGLIESAAPDVVIVDPRLPEVDGGLALIQRIRQAAPTVRILVMRSDALDHGTVAGAADGFVRKTFRPAELLAAIASTGGRIL